MTNTKEYLAMSDAIRLAAKSHRPALALHGLAVEITESDFSAAERESLRAKIAAAFGALNATAPVAHPRGRFTLLPRAAHALILVFSFFILHSSFAADSSLATRHCVDAIIGEAGNQPYATQVLVARAIHNRLAHGMGLTGVYGVNNPVVQRASAAVRARALRAWLDSSLFTRHSSLRFFGCEADRSYFLRHGFKPVLKSGAITFYQP